ncbi:hypothetical protein BT96DRAFT_923093 [Gymnopus androsaceus JB14]|uniref:Uncharacterized protein n=1 Tax=Gymnopus androsaceus JB14 TaxID=1447944 RepID=A0A6A4HAH3_9AGAR|nr:hypothetical protein BT96DRAFT_923093 [Gymnopus androsaceus JB14]
MSTVWFMVDDTDSRFNYAGEDLWSSVSGGDVSALFETMAGPVYNNTLHATSSNTSASFRFNGSAYFGLYGSIIPENSSTIDQSPFGTVECTLDGAPTEVFKQAPSLGVASNNILACRNYADNSTIHSSSGEHELIISIKYFPNSTGSQWFLDYMTYESLANPVLNGETLQAGNTDVAIATDYSMLSFGPGWSHGEGAPATSQPKANMTINFNGTSLSLYGIKTELPQDATYQVDGLEPVPFNAAQLSEAGWDQLLFTASNLTAEEHKVVITTNVNATTSSDATQFQISYFYVSSLTIAEQQSLASTTSSTAHPKSGVIIGAVLGTITAIMLLTVTMIVLWVRRRSRQKRALEMLASFPFTSQATPSAYQDLLPSRIDQLVLMLATSKKNLTDGIDPPQIEANNDSKDRQNLLTMNLKLQQRLVVTQAQAQAQEEQLNQQNQLQAQLLTVHTDSGLRLSGEETLEVPPGYTEA